jgi:hypothetical protein
MADRLFVSVLGNRHSGKTTTWSTLFGRKVNTSNQPRLLEIRPGEEVKVFVIPVGALFLRHFPSLGPNNDSMRRVT